MQSDNDRSVDLKRILKKNREYQKCVNQQDTRYRNVNTGTETYKHTEKVEKKSGYFTRVGSTSLQLSTTKA